MWNVRGRGRGGVRGGEGFGAGEGKAGVCVPQSVSAISCCAMYRAKPKSAIFSVGRFPSKRRFCGFRSAPRKKKEESEKKEIPRLQICSKNKKKVRVKGDSAASDLIQEEEKKSYGGGE